MLRPRSLATLALALAAPTLPHAHAQVVGDGVVAGNDVDGTFIRNNGVWESLPSFGAVFGLAGDNSACTLYYASTRPSSFGRSVGVLRKITRGDLLITDVGDFSATGEDGNLMLISFVGLAFHNGELIGYRSVSGGTVNAADPNLDSSDVPEGFYRINTTTGFASPALIIPTPDRNLWDFGGIDSDGTTLYGASDNLTATPSTGGVPGLYRIDLSAGTFTLVSSYPTSASYPNTGMSVRDIDGLAAGDGRVWLVPDERLTTIRPFVLATNSYAAPQDLPTPFVAANNITIFCAGAYLPCWLAPASTCDSIDFNGDGLFPDDSDLVDFLSVLAGGPCSTNTCNDIDFNGDGLFPDDSDLITFLRVLAGGECNP
jgi:hypothetical protein